MLLTIQTLPYYIYLRKKEYTYIGEVALVSDPYVGRQKDKNASMRDVWIFPLQVIQVDRDLIQEVGQLEQELEMNRTIPETEK